MTEQEMSAIIAANKGTVYSVALSHVRSRADADDVFQEVFLALYRRNPSFSDDEHIKAWLIRATINCSKKIVLSAWKRNVVQSVENAPEPSVDFDFGVEAQNDVFAAVSSLPEKYRVPILLFYFEDMTAEQIGKALKLRTETVKMQLSRAREMLREKLKGDYFYEK